MSVPVRKNEKLLEMGVWLLTTPESLRKFAALARQLHRLPWARFGFEDLDVLEPFLERQLPRHPRNLRHR